MTQYFGHINKYYLYEKEVLLLPVLGPPFIIMKEVFYMNYVTKRMNIPVVEHCLEDDIAQQIHREG